MNSPLVSIITPTYNHEKFIGQCIESVLNQTYPNWEQIIVDDGSSDRTTEVVARYKDRRIRYIGQENIGIWRLSETYNRALYAAQGELVAILEGDDCWPADKLEKQLPSFNDSEVVLSWGRGMCIDTEGNPITLISTLNTKQSKYKSTYLNKPKGMALKKLLVFNFVKPSVTIMIKRDKLLSINGFKQFSYTPFVDYPTWLELALQGEFRFVEELAGFWRRHPYQSSAKYFREQVLGQNQAALEFCNKLPVSFKKRFRINERKIRGINHWLKGRFSLFNKEWQRASREFGMALSEGPFIIRGKATIGLIACYLKTDIESLCKKMY